MKIVLVVDETPFYIPKFVEDLRSGLHPNDQLEAVFIVKTIPDKSNLEKYLIQNWKQMRFRELVYFGWKKIKHDFINSVLGGSVGGTFYSVEAFCKAHAIPAHHLHKTINDAASLAAISNYEPDAIVSSNSLFFGKKILSLPKLGCLNRHSSLLPSYGGLWPALHAIAHGETEVGVSVHTMTPEIDKGTVLVQEVVPISKGEPLTSIYARCFVQSVPAVLSALEKLRNGGGEGVQTDREASYYSFPTDDDWRHFRANGGRFS
ncbi:MAG: formyltransferase family protein [Magnetovibrio sp.]|nr:formyltransferase family protein [Magnetovibrio sp.]